MKNRKKNMIAALLLGVSILSSPLSVNAEIFNIDESEEKVDWKTFISQDISEKMLEKMFSEEYEEETILYATTYLNMRPFPNTDSDVEKVLSPNTKVHAIADYNGWTKITVKSEDDKSEKYFYLWDEYLSEEKIEEKEPDKNQYKSRYLGRFKLTAYCSCRKCCGKWAGGGTASGVMPTAGRTIAMAGVPFGTKLSINGHIYTVEDRGTAYGHVDIYMRSHSEALQFGLRYADVYQVG